jgi:NAD(P)-dependent dehydrogenase (short-subunit alcohol dehydrogenase family)
LFRQVLEETAAELAYAPSRSTSLTSRRSMRPCQRCPSGRTSWSRPGRPEDIAGTVAFLASPEAGHITAQVIHVNGGAFRGR